MHSLFEKMVFIDFVAMLDKGDFDALFQAINVLRNNITDYLCESDFNQPEALALINKIELHIKNIAYSDPATNAYERYELYFCLRCFDKACCVIENLLFDLPNDLRLLQEAAKSNYFNNNIEVAFKYAQAVLHQEKFNTTGLWVSAYYYATFNNKQLLTHTINDLLIHNIDDVKWWRFCNRSIFTKCISDPNFLINLYEQNRDKINSVDVLLYIETRYAQIAGNTSNDFPQRKQLLDALIVQHPQNTKVLFAASQYFSHHNDPENALNYAKRAFDLDPNNFIVNQKLGSLYLKFNRTEEAIEHYVNANKIEYSPFINKRVLELARDSKNALVYEDAIELSLQNGDYSPLIEEWIEIKSNDTYVSLCEIIEKIWDADYSILAAKPYSSEFSDRLFLLTNAFADRRDCRIASLALYETVSSLKKGLQYRPGANLREICHYSKITSLCHLLKDKSKSEPAKLRISNIAYMNDPSEGITFIELLETLNVPNDVICTLYPSHTGNNFSDIVYSNTFLGSFTLSKDSLPMWTQYGAGGTGCCYVFSDDYFDKGASPGIIGDVWNHTAGTGINDLTLYRVQYLDPDENNKHNLLRKNKSIKLQQLAKCLTELRSWIKTSSEIRNMVVSLLDQIRFLYKNTGYTHENEVRLVITDPQDIKTTDNDAGYIVPRLYVEIDKPLSFTEVILGPKVATPSEIAPFIHFVNKETKVSKSRIKYR